jgi:hypothetical protein
MPVEAASEMMATSLSPAMKAFFSARFAFFSASCSAAQQRQEPSSAAAGYRVDTPGTCTLHAELRLRA